VSVDLIPVYRPRLPPTEALQRYLDDIARARRYSNHGPLERRFAAGLSQLLGSVVPIAAPASSGTAALVGAILARAGRAAPPRNVCLCPAYTFVGTAAAIEQCGYRPHFVDVDPVTWQAQAAGLRAHPELSHVGLVVPVAPYGRPVPQQPWREFEMQTRIPVVIDGAAALEGMCESPPIYVGELPVALSFHATKAFGVGEGGAVISTDSDTLMRSLQALNFGFLGARRADSGGTNGKMSEYHAAVGLAELSGWADKRAAHASVCARYLQCASHHHCAESLIVAPRIASCYALYQAATANEAQSVMASLTDARAEYRYWYGLGLHQQPYFTQTGRDRLSGVDDLAPRLLGLPMAPDLTAAEVERVVAAVARARQ